jgi:hypothetical protein
MAQSGYTTIQLYSTTTPGAVPVAANLQQGELAINVPDAKLFYKNTSGVVTQLQTTGASGYSGYSGSGISGYSGLGTSGFSGYSGTSGYSGISPTTNVVTFSAYMSATQIFASGTTTKLAFDSKIFDTNTNYNTSNYRFTPTIAGYYQINFSGSANDYNLGGTVIYLYVYKNGVLYAQTRERDDNGQPHNLSMSTIVAMNGTTDYIELYGLQTGGSNVVFTGGGSIYNQFSGVLVKPI